MVGPRRRAEGREDRGSEAQRLDQGGAGTAREALFGAGVSGGDAAGARPCSSVSLHSQRGLRAGAAAATAEGRSQAGGAAAGAQPGGALPAGAWRARGRDPLAAAGAAADAVHRPDLPRL